MSRKNRIGASLLAATLIALSIYAVPDAFAKSSSGVSRYSMVQRSTSVAPSTPTMISPKGGEFAFASLTTITWKMSAAVSSGYYHVSLASTLSPTSTRLNKSKILARKGVTSYSMQWSVIQAVGTYRLWVRYYSSKGKLLGADASDSTLSIMPTPTSPPTPTPTASPSPSVTPSATPTASPSPSVTPSATPTPTPTPAPAPTIVNVVDYGATGNGTTDDTAAIKRAMTAAASSVKKVYLPAGTYAVSPITPPDGLTILGASKDSTWLKGHLDFGSNQTISDLKIGDAGNSAVYNVNGATNTTFERIHFRGGGGDRNSVIDMGGWNSCSHITFKDSEVERNLGSDPSFLNGYNNITIWEGHGSHMESILFEGVTVGVSNGAAGQNTGSPRMGLEAYVNSDSLTTTGFRDITIRNSTFEAADGETIDFSDQVGARASGILIEGNTIKGGGVTKVKWGYGLNLEVPTGVVVRNNYFTRAWMQTLNMTNRGDAFTAPGTVITGNTFDLTTGVTPLGEHPIRLWGDDNIFTGNTIIGGWDATLVALYASHRNSVTANTFRSTSNPINQYDGSSGNTLTPNVVQ